MKKFISILLIILLVSASTIAFAGFEDMGGYYLNEKARLLRIVGPGVQIDWKYSKGTLLTDQSPKTASYGYGLAPLDSDVLFTPGDSGDYLHMTKTYYSNIPGPSFKNRYLGDTPIIDEVMYKYVCVWKFSASSDQDTMEKPGIWKWSAMQKVSYMYKLIDGEYVYDSIGSSDLFSDIDVEPPFGFGTLKK